MKTYVKQDGEWVRTYNTMLDRLWWIAVVALVCAAYWWAA